MFEHLIKVLFVFLLIIGIIEARENKIKWKTEVVELTADDFYIIADGKKYKPKKIGTNISSDPGNSKHCTLEIIWHKKKIEMRIFLYFKADENEWWSYEIRTYDGQFDEDWIYYKGIFFKSKLGTPFIGDVVLKSDEKNNFNGEIYFKN